MARGERDYRVNFLANVRDFLRGTRDSGDALEDLERDFRDVDRASDTAHRSMQDAARRTARTLDDTARDAGGRFKDTGTEIGSEFAENFGEAIRSGNPAQAITDTFTSLGPALGLAGLAAAAGTGIVMGIVGRMQAERERIKQAGRKVFEALSDGIMDKAEKEDLLMDALGVDNLADAIRKAADLADTLNVPLGQVVEYLQTGGQVVGPQLAQALEDANTKAALMQHIVGRGALPAIDETVTAARDLEGAVGVANEALATGRGLAQDYRDALKDSAYWTTVLSDRWASYASRMAGLYVADPNNPAFTGRYPSSRS